MSSFSIAQKMGLQLEVSLQNKILSLVVYSQIDQTFYKVNYKSSFLPPSIVYLYGDIEHLYVYLSSISDKSNSQPYLSFQAPILTIKNFICGGTAQIKSEITLELVQIRERMQLFKKRLEKLKLQQKAIYKKTQQKNANINQNIRICQQIKREMIIRQKNWTEIRHRTQLLNQKEHELKNEISFWKEKTQLINTQLKCYVNNNQPLNQIFKFSFLPFEKNPFFEYFHSNDNTFINQIDPLLRCSQIVSNDPLPTYATWTFSFIINTCKYGLAIGLTAKQNREKQMSVSQKNTICFCTRNHSTYVNGIQTSCKAVTLSNRDTICLKIDRQTSLLTLQKNSQKPLELSLPPSLNAQMLYPFIELSHKDSISLQDDP